MSKRTFIIFLSYFVLYSSIYSKCCQGSCCKPNSISQSSYTNNLNKILIKKSNEINKIGEKEEINKRAEEIKKREEGKRRREEEERNKKLKEEEEENEEIKEKEEIEKDENEEKAISLVNNDWYESKKKNLVLKIFVKEENGNIFTSTGNEYKISIDVDEKGNPKITCQNGPENKLNLGEKKYTLFEIETQDNKIVYLYCSDVESLCGKDVVDCGIFEETKHVSISVIACDTEKVTNMWHMFANCKSLEKLEFGKSFNTSNVRDMKGMFYRCSSLTKLDLKNFNTKNVTDMGYMFSGCSSLKELDLTNFNTTNVTNEIYMFYDCKNLPEGNSKTNFR